MHALDAMPCRVAVYFFFRSTQLVAAAFPLWYTLYYMSALDARCHLHPRQFFVNFREHKMFVVFMCTQVMITRVAVLACSGRLMALSCGIPVQAYAQSSRMMWTMTTCAVALLTDMAVYLVLYLRSDFCNTSREDSKWDTVGPLCRHSSQVSMVGLIFHLMSFCFTVGLTASLISWYTTLPTIVINKRKLI